MPGYDKKTALDYYDKSSVCGKTRSVEQKRFLDLLRPIFKNKVVLDAGCGFGCEVNLLHKEVRKILGIDASPELIKIGKKKYPQISKNLYVASVDKLPFKNKSFDIIISKYVLHYLDNPDSAFKEFYRCLKPGGVLIFSVHHPISNLFLKRSEDYFKREKIRVNIMGGVNVSQPTHQITDYLSKYFLNHFTINVFKEGRGEIAISPKLKIPEYLIIKATKN